MMQRVGANILIKELLVDDHGLVRMGVKKLLDDIIDISVVAETESGEDALKYCRDNPVDVVLMDVKMPGIGGMEATRKLVRLVPGIKILALSACDEDPFPSRLIQAGAVGYLTKGAEVDEMVLAIKSVYSGKRYISPEIAQKMALKSLTDADESPFDLLSERELQVALMITSGQKVQDIAEKLHLSSKTVNSYRYRIFSKLGIASDVELTHLAIRYGLVDKVDSL